MNIKMKRFYHILTVSGLVLCAAVFSGCEREDLLSMMGDTPELYLSVHYGDASDGDITIESGTINIKSLYENDVLAGVTTYRGAGKGLNHGANSYAPQYGRCIQAENFTINSGATLTTTAWGTGASNTNGIVWIACKGTFTNNGTINLNALGGKGGGGGSSGLMSTNGSNGTGAGGGIGGGESTIPAGGRDPYGSADIDISGWNYIYGSGGGGGAGTLTEIGGGGGYKYGNGGSGGSNAAATLPAGVGGDSILSSSDDGGNGGNGGGAVRVCAVIFINTGTISCNGSNGGGDSSTYGGGGGGGSGGTVYIESSDCSLGTGTITCTGGSGGNSKGAGKGSAGSVGRIAVRSPLIAGDTSSPSYYDIVQGTYSSK